MAFDSLIKAYIAADQFLVDRANEAVKAWNWTTGRTRAELADVVNVVGGTFISYSSKSPLITSVLIPAIGIPLFLVHKDNKRIDRQDEEAKNKQALSYESERAKKIMKITSPLQAGCGLVIYSSENARPTENNLFDGNLFGFGSIIISLSGYIMRAGYQAPRKDCVRRGIEKIKQGLERIAERWQPVPEAVNTGGYR